MYVEFLCQVLRPRGFLAYMDTAKAHVTPRVLALLVTCHCVRGRHTPPHPSSCQDQRPPLTSWWQRAQVRRGAGTGHMGHVAAAPAVNHPSRASLAAVPPVLPGPHGAHTLSTCGNRGVVPSCARGVLGRVAALPAPHVVPVQDALALLDGRWWQRVAVVLLQDAAACGGEDGREEAMGVRVGVRVGMRVAGRRPGGRG
jgi:hypothetical protein